MLDPSWIFPLSFFISLTICILLMPHYIKKAKAADMVGIDVHKPDMPKIAESGGIILMLAYLLGLFIFIPFLDQPSTNIYTEEIIGTAATVLFSTFIGLIDDIYETRWRIKTLTPMLGGVPLAVMSLGRPTISTPFGILNFTLFGLFGLIFFYAFVVPFIVTACANAVNMLAGLNGLEAGSTLIIASALTLLSIRYGKNEGLIILIPFLGALIAFLYYNKYPSRVFPGDVGTFGMGTVIACVAMLAHLERAVFVMFLPHTVNAILFFIGKLKGKAPPREAPMNPNGTIPCPTKWSLRCLILQIQPMKEKTLTYVMWIIIALFAVVGMFVYGL
jgi:UDP-N-acetylglucosamine--dolichyl-phosphate N-acetylglucosaminephosphotransferase